MNQPRLVPWRSIRFSLTLVFLLFVVLTVSIGALALRELGFVNAASAEIRDRWLQSTRILGDLNNYTSDVRAAEASHLLAQNESQSEAVERDLTSLIHSVDRSDRAYRLIPHEAEEMALYEHFIGAWREYQSVAERVLDASRLKRSFDAGALYMNDSLRAYNAASNDLGVLTNRTVERAALANSRAMGVYRTARTLTLWVIASACLTLILAVSYISSRITRPILQLAEQMRAIANHDLSAEIQGATRKDEIGEMARAVVVFRSNAVELAHSQHGLIQQASMLEERLEAEQKLTHLQRNVFSMASHEFRTPLNVIDGHAQRLIKLKASASGEEVTDRALRIRRAVRQMTLVIEQHLSSARFLEGEPGLYFHPQPLEPQKLLHEVCQLHREISTDARIVEDLTTPHPVIIGDYNLLYQAFSNLLSNAVKYSPDNGLIHVRTALQPGFVAVTIEDHGLGIPEADRDHIFERYHRGTNVSGIVGTGIGLFLVKIVIELHKGEVKLESHEGQGSRFTVRLPICETASPSDPGSASRPQTELGSGSPS